MKLLELITYLQTLTGNPKIMISISEIEARELEEEDIIEFRSKLCFNKDIESMYDRNESARLGYEESQNRVKARNDKFDL